MYVFNLKEKHNKKCTNINYYILNCTLSGSIFAYILQISQFYVLGQNPFFLTFYFQM